MTSTIGAQKSLNFAYGSNLDLAGDWEAFCRERGYASGLLVPIRPAVLPDFELAFTKYSHKRQGGVLDIRPRLGCVTPGMLFEVRGEGWDALDAKEGAPSHYCRRGVTVLTDGNVEVPAVAYQVTEAEDFVEASTSYVEVVRRGLAAFDLDAEPLEDAVANRRAGALNALFVYGTLMLGELRHSAIRAHHPKYVLPARVPGPLLDLGGFPGLVRVSGSVVDGELVGFDDIERVLREVDQIESFHGWGAEESLYRRILVGADVGDGRVRRAWTYEYQGEAFGTAIQSGSWRKHT